jgi:tetratricopeptide (TPR) repeat protein
MSNPMQWYAQALESLDRGDWRAAHDFAMRVARHAPAHGGVQYVAGIAALQLQRVPLAIEHLGQAVRLAPGRVDYMAQYGRALAMADRLREALDVADAAMALSSDDATSFDTLGVIYSRANAHRRSAAAFQRAVELAPAHAGYRFNLATAWMFIGDFEAAQREFEACVGNDPRYWRAHLGLSQLRRQTEGSNHVARLESLLPQYRQEADAQLYLNLALAKEYEDLGDFPRAFDRYVRGKSAHGSRIGYSPRRDAAAFDWLMRNLDAPATHGTGFDSAEPIFVLGMPRSGTTLTDRILSAHPAVHSAGELGNFGRALQRATGKPARSLADVLANLDLASLDWSRLGQAYVDSTRPGTGHTPHFVDKLPHNFLHAGFIARALPNAKIICLRRDPMDTCLSNFRQLFALELPTYDYSYDLLDTGRYYLQFDRLMKHWQQVLPGRILEVDYEQLVESQEAATRTLLDFCGLPWDEACLRFEANAAPVATASAVQVRSGMNRASMHRWKRYEAQLGELRRLLEDGGIRVG